eukprot:c27727_g1_i2 orf=348-1331(+)
MAGWIRRGFRLGRLIGVLKDHAAVSRAFTKNGCVSLRIAVLRATSHEEKLPDEKYVKAVLSSRSGSRMRVSHCILVIVKRLNKTRNWVVALKCLILIHRGIHDGGFIFRDELSFYPASGRRNILNLSNFRDKSSTRSWEVSSWIRWYANFLDHWLVTIRALRICLDSPNKGRSGKIISLSTQELVTEISTLQDFLQESCKLQATGIVIENVLVKEAFRMVLLDSFKVQEELEIRMKDVPERFVDLQNSEVLQLLQLCEKWSVQSLTFMHLMRVCDDLSILRTLDCPGKAMLTDYDVIKMTEALRAASRQNVVPSVQHTATNELLPLL